MSCMTSGGEGAEALDHDSECASYEQVQRCTGTVTVTCVSPPEVETNFGPFFAG